MRTTLAHEYSEECLILRKRFVLVTFVIIFFILMPSHASAQQSSLTRYPYIQNVGTSSVIIAWKTNVPTDSVVEFGSNSGYGFMVMDATKSTTHALTLSGLSPDTTYHYRVKGGGRTLSSDEVFRTTPVSHDSPISFVVFGDSGDGGPNTIRTANLVRNLNPDFLIHTGDINYPRGEESAFDHRFFVPYKDTLKSKPVYPALGNHDVLTDKGRPWLDAFYLPENNYQRTERYYSFDYGNAHFVSLEVVEDDPLSTDQINWLITDLLNTSQTWKFVYFHVPPYSSSRHGSAMNVRKSLSPILEWFQVDIVFSGHDHDYERTLPIKDFYPDKRGVTYVVTGGAGDGLYPSGRSSFTAYSESAYHATYVQIDRSVFTLQAIRNDGSIMDTLTIDKGMNLFTGSASGKKSSSSNATAFGSVVVCSSTVTDTSRCNYKAKGTNDQNVINPLLRESQHVVLSEGIFSLSDSIALANDRITLSDQGPGTVLQVSANKVTAIQVNAVNEVVFRDFTIDGNKSAYQGTRGIRINDGNASLQLDNLTIINTNSGQPDAGFVVGSALSSSNSHLDFKGNYRRKIVARNLHLKDNVGGLEFFDIYDSFFTDIVIEGGGSAEGGAWVMNRAYRVNLQNVRISTKGGYSIQILYFKDLNLSNIIAQGGEVNVINLLGGARGHSANANLTNVVAFGGGPGSDGIDVEGINRLNMTNIVTYGNGSDGIEVEGEPRSPAMTEFSLTNVQSYANGRSGLLLINVRRGSIFGGSFINNATSYNGTSFNDSAGIVLVEGTKNIIVVGATVGDTQATEPVGIVEARSGQTVLQVSGANPPGGAAVFFSDQLVTISDGQNAETNSVVRSYTIGPHHFLELKNKLANTYATNATVTGTRTQHYGIEERDAATDYNSFLFNNFTGNVAGAVKRANGASGSNDYFLGNRGYPDTIGTAATLSTIQK